MVGAQKINKLLTYGIILALSIAILACGGGGGSAGGDSSAPASTLLFWDQANWNDATWE